MMLSVLLLSLVAVVSSQSVSDATHTFELNGRQMLVFQWSRGYQTAKSECENRGAGLLTLCNFEELAEVRDTGFRYSDTHEFWIAFPSSLNHHANIDPKLFTSMTEGNNCRILSNWYKAPWRVFTKACSGNRWFICETNPRTSCTAEPEVVVEPTAAPTAPPTAAPTAPPTAAPTAAPTAPPTVPPTEPARCEKEVAKFKAKSGLDFEPSFDGDSCAYLAKQCNGEKCFCVNPKNAKLDLEMPAGTEYDCSSKPSKCQKAMFKAIAKNQSYQPQCNAKGAYLSKQCDSTGACWCVNKKGKEQKKTRNADGAAVEC